MLLYCAGWVVRGVESLVFLSLLDVTLSLNVAVLLESTLVLVRSMAVPVPAGLGVQDVGYVLSLRALGIPDATTVSAAFVLMKRGRDVFWIVVGFLLLGGERTKVGAESLSFGQVGPAESPGDHLHDLETEAGDAPQQVVERVLLDHRGPPAAGGGRRRPGPGGDRRRLRRGRRRELGLAAALGTGGGREVRRAAPATAPGRGRGSGRRRRRSEPDDLARD